MMIAVIYFGIGIIITLLFALSVCQNDEDVKKSLHEQYHGMVPDSLVFGITALCILFLWPIMVYQLVASKD